MDEFEIKIVRFLNQIGSKKMDSFLGFINSIRFLAFFWLVLAAVAVAAHPIIAKEFVLAVAIVTLLHFAITEGIIKHLLTYFFAKRKRPYIKYPEIIKPIGKKFSDSSFPSSHMATTVAMLFVIVNFYPSLFLLSVLMVVLMAFSRLHNGMHYLTDVLAGVLLGIGYGYWALQIVKSLLPIYL